MYRIICIIVAIFILIVTYYKIRLPDSTFPQKSSANRGFVSTVSGTLCKSYLNDHRQVEHHSGSKGKSQQLAASLVSLVAYPLVNQLRDLHGDVV